MKKIALILLVVALVLTMSFPAFARNDKVRGRWQGAGIALGVITLFGLAAHQHSQPGVIYGGRYPILAGGNVVSVLNGTVYDIDVTGNRTTIRLGPGVRADFPTYFDQANVFTAVVLDNGVAIGTVQQSFYTGGQPQVWHITYFQKLTK